MNELKNEKMGELDHEWNRAMQKKIADAKQRDIDMWNGMIQKHIDDVWDMHMEDMLHGCKKRKK
jgi:hypothetical protein